MFEINSFKPTEVWFPESEDFELEEAIKKAREEMNRKNPEQLIENLKNKVESSERGVVFAVLKGDRPEEYSSTDGLVMFNPFANVATPNMLVRAEFIREVAKFADCRDENGRLKPVIMLASPGLNGSKVKLSRQDRQEVNDGELGPIARELLRAVSEKEIGKVALLGFSQGADMALAGGRSAYSANLDTQTISIGDPAGVEVRKLTQLGKDFAVASPDLEAAADRTKLKTLRLARTGRGEYARFLVSSAMPINWLAISRALGTDSFERRMQEVLEEGRVCKITVGYGGSSTISKPEAIEPAIERLYKRYGEESIVSIKVDGAKHSWGDQLTLLAKLYLKALQ